MYCGEVLDWCDVGVVCGCFFFVDVFLVYVVCVGVGYGVECLVEYLWVVV